MSERPIKRTRRQTSDDSEGTDDWEEEALRMNARPSDYRRQPQASMARTRRGREPEPSVERSPSMSSDAPPKRSIRLNIKPPSRLQEFKDGVSDDNESAAPRGRRETLARNSKNRKPVVDEPSEEEEEEEEVEDQRDSQDDSILSEEPNDESDEEEEEEEELLEAQDEDDEGGGDEEEEEDQDGEDDEEGEEEDDEGQEQEDSDVEMEDEPASAPQQPRIKISAPRKPSPNRALKKNGRHIQSVEDREMANPDVGTAADDIVDEGLGDDDDEDLDDLDEEDFDDDMDDRNDIITADAIGEDELDTDDSGTPDPSKMTRRQRRTSPSTLLALSNEAQKKKFFTAEQLTVRRAEMARRRKDLSEKRNEEEKKDTLKRLLEKPAAPKRRNKAQMMADAEREEFGTPARIAEAEGTIDIKKGYIRTVMNDKGTTVSVPREWLGKEAGRIFDESRRNTSGGLNKPWRMVEVVE